MPYNPQHSDHSDRAARLYTRRGGSRSQAATLSLAVVSLIALGGCSSESQFVPDPLVVEVTQIEPQPFSEHLELMGQIEARDSVVIQPEVAGIVESVEFREGQRVQTGDVLFVLRSEEQRASLRAAIAEHAKAADHFERTEKLSKVKVSAASELNSARAEVDATLARVDLARIDVQRTKIRAPFDGGVGARLVSPGDYVDTDSEMVKIDSVDRLFVSFSVPESAIALVRSELVVSARVAAYPEETFWGEVYFVSPSLDSDTRRLSLKASMSNDDGRLRSGMFARLELETDHVSHSLLAPDSAIAYDAAGAFVWRVTDDFHAERVSVELGPRHDGLVVLRSGIRAGDPIVTSGTHKLHSGIPLTVRNPEHPVATLSPTN